MDPMTIALICTAVFGTVMVASAFVRQLLLSRDKRLNDEAQSRALAQEATELEKMRAQMLSKERYTAHYEVLGNNKNAIEYIDTQIEDYLRRKTELVEKYSKLVTKETSSIISKDEVLAERKEAFNKMKADIDANIALYETEIATLQKRRSTLWDAHTNFQKHLLDQEKIRNSNLDAIYKQHAALLEKVYLRHIDDAEVVAMKALDAGTLSFKDMLMAPIQFLMQFFAGGAPAPSVAFVQTRVEHAARADVAQAEREINNPVVEAAPAPQPPEQKSPAKVDNAAQPEEEEDVSSSISFAS